MVLRTILRGQSSAFSIKLANVDPTLVMRRCLDLAILGKQGNKINPNVGSVLINCDGNVVSEGYYQIFGGPHAEYRCLDGVAVSPSDHLFVSLEPCNVHGKTPPCRDMLLAKGVKHVHVGCSDPNPSISGTSLQQLEQEGTEVVPSGLEKSAQSMIRQFAVNTLEQRPYIILKWAESADRLIAKNNEQVQLSNWASERLVHKWRSEVDAILVGTNTALIDNPRLTNRLYSGKNPIRLVLDRQARLPETLNLLDGSVATIVLGRHRKNGNPGLTTYMPYDQPNDLLTCLTNLYQKQVGSVLIEGGAQTLSFLMDAGYWDECRIIRTPHVLGSGIPAPDQPTSTADQMALLDDEIVVCYRHGLSKKWTN